MTILAQQEVKDGKIDLRTDQFKIPGRVWVDIDGKATVEAILDTKDMIWIKGKINSRIKSKLMVLWLDGRVQGKSRRCTRKDLV